MSIILAPITGGVHCGYSSTGPTLKKIFKKKKGAGGEVGGGRCEGVKWGGGGGVNTGWVGGRDTLSSFSV